MTEHHNVTITWSNRQGATIEGLTLEQTRQLSSILEASGEWYQWEGRLAERTDWLARLNGLWIRINAWLMGGAFLLLVMLNQPLLGQSLKPRPRPVEPIHVSITSTAEENETDQAFNKLFHSQLNRLRDVAFTSKRADWAITTASTPITDDGKVIGYACAILAVQLQSRHFKLMIEIGPELKEISERATLKLSREVFGTKKEKKYASGY
jgi:hypothetical protein